MRVRRKKSLIEQASDYVESVIPKIEAAASNARDRAAPVIADARDNAGPALADARDRAKPYLAAGAAVAAEKAQVGASLAAEKAAQGRDLAQAKVAELQGKPQKQKGSTFKKVLVITGLAAVAAFVAKKLQSSGSQDTWQSSYTPAPAPTTAPPPAAPVGVVDDEAGSSPDEALSDAVGTEHPVTTPDDPAAVTEVEGDPLTDPIETIDDPSKRN